MIASARHMDLRTYEAFQTLVPRLDKQVEDPVFNVNFPGPLGFTGNYRKHFRWNNVNSSQIFFLNGKRESASHSVM